MVQADRNFRIAETLKAEMHAATAYLESLKDWAPPSERDTAGIEAWITNLKAVHKQARKGGAILDQIDDGVEKLRAMLLNGPANT